MLKVLLLGTPVVLYEDKPLKILRRQLRSILCFLACHSDGISRSEILTVFWPEISETEGRKNLRETLSKLRTQLPNPEILQTELDRIRLNPEYLYSDVIEFKKLIQQDFNRINNSSQKSSLIDTWPNRLESAVGLWRSPRFWAGVRSGNNPEFDNWLQEMADLLEFNLVQTLERLANHFSSSGEFERAIHYTQNALKTDEHNEELQEQMLALLYKAGRISEAQTYYSYLKELYKREYDDEPPAIIQHTLQVANQYTFDGQDYSEITWDIKANANQHFVGRVNELNLLKNKLQHGDVIFLVGEAGIGKTRLVHQFFNSLDRKPRLFVSTCHQMESDLPLQPLIELIKNQIREEDWINLDPQWLQALSILVPGFIRSNNKAPFSTSSSPAHARSVLFEAIRQLFLFVSRSNKILFVLDDAHWSDFGTLEFLMYLIQRNFFIDRGSCIVISRPVVQNPKIHDLFFSNPNPLNVSRINLGLMDEHEVAELVRYSLGQNPTDGFLHRINGAAGGNPLFIIETINTILLSSNDHARIQEQGDLPLATGISIIAKEKLFYLSEAARKVILAAAISGMEFQIDVLELVESIDPDHLVRCLEELEEKQFIQPVMDGGASGRYTFIHNLIREAIVAQVSHARQCLLHNQIATAMSASQSHFPKENAGVIARHFEEAGRPLPAFRNWVKAGQYARGIFATHEAYTAFRHADLLKSRMESAISEDDLYSLYSEWGDLAYAVMDLPTLEECYTAMYLSGVQKKSPLLIGSGFSGLALPAVLGLDIQKAQVLLEQAIVYLSKTDYTYEKIQAFSRMGITLAMSLHHQKAIEKYLQAIELGKDNGSPAIRTAITTVQFQLSILYSLLGWPLKAIETGVQSLNNSYLLVSNPYVQSQAHLALALANFYSNSLQDMREHIQKCLETAESFQVYRTATLAYLIQARGCLVAGRLNKAWELAQKSLHISQENGYFENIAEAHCILGDYYRMINNFPKAIEEYTNGCEGLLQSHQGMNSYFRLGYSIARNGETDRGMKILDSAIEFTKEVGFGSIYILAQVFRAIILKGLNRIEEAEVAFRQTAQEANERGIGTVNIVQNHFQNRFLLDPGDINEAYSTVNRLMHEPVIISDEWLSQLAINLRATLEDYSGDSEFSKQDIFNFLDNLAAGKNNFYPIVE
jgi:DNA-binding SARP family transcriptional activator